MNIKEIMNENVITIDKKKSVQEAAEKMSKYRVGALIVTSKKHVEGIVTERDVLLKVTAKSLDAKSTKVSDIMTEDVIMVKPEIELEDVVDIMLEKEIKRLPVVKDNKLIGIVTTMDIIKSSPEMIEKLSELLLIPKERHIVAG